MPSAQPENLSRISGVVSGQTGGRTAPDSWKSAGDDAGWDGDAERPACPESPTTVGRCRTAFQPQDQGVGLEGPARPPLQVEFAFDLAVKLLGGRVLAVAFHDVGFGKCPPHQSAPTHPKPEPEFQPCRPPRSRRELGRQIGYGSIADMVRFTLFYCRVDFANSGSGYTFGSV